MRETASWLIWTAIVLTGLAYICAGSDDLVAYQLTQRQQREIITRWDEPMNSMEVNAVLSAPKTRGVE